MAECAACQRWQVELARAMDAVRADAAAVPLPDVEAEWRRLQDRLAAPRRRRLAPITWIGLPLAAAAAIALAFFVTRPGPAGFASGGIASVDYVEVAGRDATPVVYLDNDSGMLVVWAVDNGGDPKAD